MNRVRFLDPDTKEQWYYDIDYDDIYSAMKSYEKIFLLDDILWGIVIIEQGVVDVFGKGAKFQRNLSFYDYIYGKVIFSNGRKSRNLYVFFE